MEMLLCLNGNWFESSSNPVIFSSSHVQKTLRPCYICDKLSPNLRHPAPLTSGYLGVLSTPSSPISHLSQKRDAHVRSPQQTYHGRAQNKQWADYSLHTIYLADSVFFFFPLLIDASMNKLLCIYYCLLFIYAKLFNEYFTWANFSLGVCNELSFD